MEKQTPYSLTYSAPLLRVLVKFPSKLARELLQFPKEITDKARNKLENVKEQKLITSYILYEEKLKEVWELIRSSKPAQIDNAFEIQFPFGVGLTAQKTATESLNEIEKLLNDLKAKLIAPVEKKPPTPAPLQNSKSKKQPPPQDYPGKGLLSILISQDLMSITISNFSTSNFDLKDVTFDEKWLDYEVTNLKIISPIEANVKRVIDNMKRKRDINGFVLAEGKPPIAASEPFIEQIVAEEKEGENFRKKRRKDLVISGQFVAQVSYAVKGVDGVDVNGNPIPPPKPAPMEAVVGGGIKQEENKFISIHDGILSIAGQKIEVKKIYVHTGAVNLASGDIEFNGPILIEGMIDTGAKVSAKGDVTITGDIRGGEVVCSGNLTVEGGIITSQQSAIFCKGNIRAGFIENSVIYCSGEIFTNNAIISSTIYVGLNLKANPTDGVIAGCQIYVANEVSAAHIGFATGQRTLIQLGCNWKEVLKMKIVQQRLRKVNAEQEKTKAEFREVVRKAQKTNSEKDNIHKAKLQNRVSKLSEIQKKLEDKISKFPAKPFLNDNALIIAHKQLQPSVRVMVRNKEIPIKDSYLAGAVVFPLIQDRSESPHIMPLEKYLAKIKPKEEAKESAPPAKLAGVKGVPPSY